MKMKHLSEYRGMQWNRVKVNEKIRNIYREFVSTTWQYMDMYICMYVHQRLAELTRSTGSQIVSKSIVGTCTYTAKCRLKRREQYAKDWLLTSSSLSIISLVEAVVSFLRIEP